MTSPDLSDLYDYQAKDGQQAIDAAIAAVQSFCGWSIAPSASDTASVWSADGVTVFLPTLQLTAVSSVTQDGTTFTDYTFDEGGSITLNSGCFSRSTKVTVAFTHGYSAMPNDVKNVILGLAQRSISDTRGLVAGPPGAGTATYVAQTYGPQFTETDKDRLAPFVVKAGFAY